MLSSANSNKIIDLCFKALYIGQNISSETTNLGKIMYSYLPYLST